MKKSEQKIFDRFDRNKAYLKWWEWIPLFFVKPHISEDDGYRVYLKHWRGLYFLVKMEKIPKR